MEKMNYSPLIFTFFDHFQFDMYFLIGDLLWFRRRMQMRVYAVQRFNKNWATRWKYDMYVDIPVLTAPVATGDSDGCIAHSMTIGTTWSWCRWRNAISGRASATAPPTSEIMLKKNEIRNIDDELVVQVKLHRRTKICVKKNYRMKYQ